MRIGSFIISTHWGEPDPSDDGWWWVYCLGRRPPTGAFIGTPDYVGMAGNIRRRLMEHTRVWGADVGFAHLYAANSEKEARRLEATLIRLLRPPGNGKPRMSWLEAKYLDGLRRRPFVLCSGCSALCHETTNGLEPVTEPDDTCVYHYGSAQAEALSETLPKVFGGCVDPNAPAWNPHPGSIFDALADLVDAFGDKDAEPADPSPEVVSGLMGDQ